MPGLVEGKAGLVTGSAGGIGRATALALAREGAAGILVTDLPSRQEDGEETVHLIEQGGGHAVFVPGDVTVAADCQAVVTNTVEAFGHLDFAHNNAGVASVGQLKCFAAGAKKAPPSAGRQNVQAEGDRKSVV